MKPKEFSEGDLAALEHSTRRIGQFLLDHSEERQPSVWERKWWDDRIMSWAMHDESVKVQLFRFVDVLPMLNTSESLVRHLHEYFEEVEQNLPSAARVAVAAATPGSIAGRALSIAARRNAQAHARRFIAGSNTKEVLAAAKRERSAKRAFTLDLLGEAVISQTEADRFFQAYVNLIERIAPEINSWPEEPLIDSGPDGPLPRVNISVKLSALDAHFDAIDVEGTMDRAGSRLRDLFRVAARNRAFINVDMESYGTKDLTLHIFRRVLAEEEFRHVRDAGIVIQCYLRDAEKDLAELQQWAEKRGTPVWVRLVKGAYWDYETTHAAAVGWPVPVFLKKWETDANFEKLSRLLLSSYEHLRPAIGSHNIRSIAHGIAIAEYLDLPQGALELQMLYGMGDAEKQALVDAGNRLRIYMPYGELIPGMAYLVRRLLENTSNDSFLRASFSENVPAEELLANPLQVGEDNAVEQESSESVSRTRYPAQFCNQPHADFSRQENRTAMQSAIAEVETKLGKSYDLWIGSEKFATQDSIISLDPSQKTRVVGKVSSATTEDVNRAVRAAKSALSSWSGLPVKERSLFLRRAAECMQRRRFELAAWEVFECAKPWRDADGDVCEAIDFCNYYADRADELFAVHGSDVPGEENRFQYLPRGVTAVISPWNFPLAILTGMTSAALVAGNTVIMKPAEQSPVTAYLLKEIFAEVGLPSGVLNYLPGRGEVAGAALVEHSEVALIAFTGSKEVGLAINAKAAEVSARRIRIIKHVIAEMGGKNAIIVDSDADLDEAVAGVLNSAFGYAGQKCSACSRVIVLDAIHDQFVGRLVEATRSLKIGPAADPGIHVPAVIDEDAFRRIRDYIRFGQKESRLALAVDVGDLADQGYFLGPNIFVDVSSQARIAQEEIFGPLVAVTKARDFDQALEIANGTAYALTGGVFSRSPANLDKARDKYMVGNLYLNREITGALVGRQPFGGFKMSGMGSKAGGKDYLLQFVVPRTVTENTMRRGFAPTGGQDKRS